jgi:hypothetical protein
MNPYEAFTKEALNYTAGKKFIRSMGVSFAGHRRAAVDAGPESFLAEAAGFLLPKKVREGIKNKMWKYVSKPALVADTYLGSKVRKVPGMKGLFTAKEQIPVHGNMHKDVERGSLLAPLAKARNIAVPIVAGIGIEKGIRDISAKLKGQPLAEPPGNHAMMNQEDLQKAANSLNTELREKVASAMLQLNSKNKEHEKRAQATRFLFKQSELGLASLPSTYDEYEQKLASLVGQDLAVLEKALELTAGNVKLGELTGSALGTHDAAETFQAEVLSY